MKEYQLSESLAWQKIEKYDLIYVLDLKSGNFYYFTGTGAFIMELILKRESNDVIIKECLDTYMIDDSELNDYLNDFYVDLEKVRIIEVN